MSFGDELSRALKLSRMSQTELAKQVGLSQKSISRYICGEVVPDISVQYKLLSICDHYRSRTKLGDYDENVHYSLKLQAAIDKLPEYAFNFVHENMFEFLCLDYEDVELWKFICGAKIQLREYILRNLFSDLSDASLITPSVVVLIANGYVYSSNEKDTFKFKFEEESESESLHIGNYNSYLLMNGLEMFLNSTTMEWQYLLMLQILKASDTRGLKYDLLRQMKGTNCEKN